jgi:thiamine-phosphate pyrophosphorylase
MASQSRAATDATDRAGKEIWRVAGLYAVTPDLPDTDELTAKVEAVLEGGCRLLQYRNKTAGSRLLKEQATAIRAQTRHHGARLIINDHVLLALDVGADGVHLGKDDADLHGLRAARAKAGHSAGFSIGVSCYNQLERAEQAVQCGADYLAFGSMFSSMTKPHAGAAPLSLLSAAKARFSLPVVAIGGISTQNAMVAVAAGADAIAVISALFEAGTLPEIRAQAHLFTSYFSNHV